ncbi:MAG: hypothetical protein WCA06_16545 [Terrimicrobiaceae bacterium]
MKTIGSQKRGACKPDPNTQATRKITKARSQAMGHPNQGLVRILREFEIFLEKILGKETVAQFS